MFVAARSLFNSFLIGCKSEFYNSKTVICVCVICLMSIVHVHATHAITLLALRMQKDGHLCVIVSINVHISVINFMAAVVLVVDASLSKSAIS